MSAAAVAVPYMEPENNKGYFRLRRGEPEKDAISEPMWNYERLRARAGADGFFLVLHIMERADLPFAPEYVGISLSHLANVMRRSERYVRMTLKFLEAKKFISQNPEEPWHFKAHPENFEKAEVLILRTRHVTPKPRLAEVRAEVDQAAYRNEPGFTPLQAPPSEPGFTPPQPSTVEPGFTAPVGHSAPPPSEPGFTPTRILQFPASEPRFTTGEPGFTACEAEFREIAARCPLGAQCPLVSNALHADKPLSLEALKPEDTVREKADIKVDDASGPDLPPSPAFGFAAFWTQYPRKVNRKAAEHAWDVTVTPASVEKVLACLDRYLESRDVKDGVVRNPDKWLHLCRHDNWESDWPKSAPPKEKPDFVSNVTRVIEDNLRKTGKPW